MSISPTSRQTVPFAVKTGYTAFMAVLVPVYWTHYGPTNFLYFCDLALILTLVGVWAESPCSSPFPPSAFWPRRYSG